MEFEGKKCHEEPRDKTGMEAQTYWRADLGIWGGEGLGPGDTGTELGPARESPRGAGQKVTA